MALRPAFAIRRFDNSLAQLDLSRSDLPRRRGFKKSHQRHQTIRRSERRDGARCLTGRKGSR